MMSRECMDWASGYWREEVGPGICEMIYVGEGED